MSKTIPLLRDVKEPQTWLTVLNKMREQRPIMAKLLFDHEILNVPQSLSTDGVSMYHGSKSDIAKRLKTYSQETISNRKSVVEMSNNLY